MIDSGTGRANLRRSTKQLQIPPPLQLSITWEETKILAALANQEEEEAEVNKASLDYKLGLSACFTHKSLESAPADGSDGSTQEHLDPIMMGAREQETGTHLKNGSDCPCLPVFACADVVPSASK